MLTIFVHSKVRNVLANDASKGTFLNCLLEKNQNVVEDVNYDTFITKSFYFMLNRFFTLFNPT